ncbi:hypothetical protein KY308_03580 [Candidatus Woesearchaeota archaeon]|nr:hypothetical protein [Candidatus Woesearchaeota archaeon]
MNIQFTPGPYERRVSNRRISLPDEDVRAIMAVQPTRDVAFVENKELTFFYPLELCDRIMKMVGEVKEYERADKVARKVLKDPWLSIFLGNLTAQITKIDSCNKLYLPEKSILAAYNKVIVEGFEGYFTIKGKE